MLRQPALAELIFRKPNWGGTRLERNSGSLESPQRGESEKRVWRVGAQVPVKIMSLSWLVAVSGREKRVAG